MRMICIDPGASGAYALFDGKSLVYVGDLSYVEIGKHKMVSLLDVEADVAIVEHVGAIKGQGVTSMFSFGERFGEAKMLAVDAVGGIDKVKFVRPQAWKKAVGLIGKDKAESAIMAAKIYPAMAGLFVEPNKRCKNGLKYHDGRGDAVMMGLAAIKLGLTVE
jgi:crossover junction endodeoxyribonuclease RuvC